MGTQTQWGPRIYGNRTNNTWTEKICDSDGSNCKTETYYTTVQDPGDGGPFGASGDLAGKTTIYKRNDGLLDGLPDNQVMKQQEKFMLMDLIKEN